MDESVDESATLDEKVFTIRNQNLDGETLDFNTKDRHTDVTLTFDDGKQIPCHRGVLSSVSDYFQCLLSNGMMESRQDEIHICDVSSSAMAKALKFLYKRRCSFKGMFLLVTFAFSMGHSVAQTARTTHSAHSH